MQDTGRNSQTSQKTINVLIVAAEASSAMYATALLKHWREQGHHVNAYGIGSEDMRDLGFDCIGRSEELAVMGLQEIISHWSQIKLAFNGLVAAAKQRKPDVVILMDYPEFNLRLAKKVKALGLPVVYYISPQIWAWRTYRVKKIKRLVDLMLVLFPFEKDFYDKHGVDSQFVGHPLVDFLDDLRPSKGQTEKNRLELMTQGRSHILGLMPGSRHSEIRYNLATQIETAKKVVRLDPQVLPVVFVAPGLELNTIEHQCRELGFDGPVIQKDPFVMIDLADTILCVSGTATLMVGLCEKPMVIMYKVKPLTAFLARRLVKHVPFFGMVNLVSRKEVVPERFQEKANADELSKLLLEMMPETSAQRLEIVKKLRQLKSKLGEKGGVQSLATHIESFIDRRKKQIGTQL